MNPILYLLRMQKSSIQTDGVVLIMRGAHCLFNAHSLELPWKDNSPRISCIEPGEYFMTFQYSPAFKTKLWELQDVPGRSEVKFHRLNYVYQSNGCIGVGKIRVDINGDGTLDLGYSQTTLNGMHKVLQPYEQERLRCIVVDMEDNVLFKPKIFVL